MASTQKSSYYYKSPVRKAKIEKETEVLDKSVGKKSRKVSKSPTVSSQATNHGMPQSILSYVKLIDELKAVCNTIDENTVEINHLVELFNKREATLKTDEAKEEAKRLREVYGIPEEM